MVGIDRLQKIYKVHVNKEKGIRLNVQRFVQCTFFFDTQEQEGQIQFSEAYLLT